MKLLRVIQEGQFKRVVFRPGFSDTAQIFTWLREHSHRHGFSSDRSAHTHGFHEAAEITCLTRFSQGMLLAQGGGCHTKASLLFAPTRITAAR